MQFLQLHGNHRVITVPYSQGIGQCRVKALEPLMAGSVPEGPSVLHSKAPSTAGPLNPRTVLLPGVLHSWVAGPMGGGVERRAKWPLKSLHPSFILKHLRVSLSGSPELLFSVSQPSSLGYI